MAVSSGSNRDTVLGLIAGTVLVMLLALLVVNGGHNGQPSSRSGGQYHGHQPGPLRG